MTSLGLPDLGRFHNYNSFNVTRGMTRGIHAEPRDKDISVTAGSVSGTWADLRAGNTLGTVFPAVIDSLWTIFVPRGVCDAFQRLENNTAYIDLVNDPWSV